METINELINEIYEDNYSHLEFDDAMGGDCDCVIHTTLNTIVKYRDGERRLRVMSKCKECDEMIDVKEYDCEYCEDCCYQNQMSWQTVKN